MSWITTHVLDTAAGRPARGVEVSLARRDAAGQWTDLASGRTDADGRVRDLLPDGARAVEGTYRLRFAVGPYYDSQDRAGFYPYVDVIFRAAPGEHYHVPLLVSPFGYTTYRGS